MDKNQKSKKYLKIIKQIEKVRAKNNKNWMDLYRLAFSTAPDESIKIISKILKKDNEVSKLAKSLIKKININILKINLKSFDLIKDKSQKFKVFYKYRFNKEYLKHNIKKNHKTKEVQGNFRQNINS